MLLVFFLLFGCTDRAADTASLVDSGEAGSQPAPERPPEPARWEAPGDVDTVSFPAGPQAGDPESDRVILMARSDLEQATVVVMQADGDGWTEVARQAATRDPALRSLRVELTGLAPDTAYNYAFYAGDPDAGASRSAVGRFRTGLDDTGFRKLTLGATSCLGGNEPWPNMRAIATEDLDAFLFLGDMVYADATTLEEYRADWDPVMTTEGMVELNASTATISTWDDHEVANNWTWDEITPDRYEAALTAFRESMPQATGPTGGIWRQVHWGRVLDVFVLDSRSERDADIGQYISPEQMTWLQEGLAASDAAFKIIMTSVPITDMSDFIGTAAADDRWQGFPEQREEILSFIDDNDIGGVLWIAGDVHFGMVATVGIPGSDGPGLHQWEVAVGPAGSTPNVAADLWKNDQTHYRLLFSTWNSARLTLDPGTMTAQVDFIGDDGLVFAGSTLQL
ncbi:MAG: hypothetical protein D6798_06270 [Deltaproteobacteria bacterium]|nr:MAG: hypothetical protein D6798_06270 [Deltaproteobacteria bacterium]